MLITGSCGICLACPSCLLGAVVSVPLGDAGCARPASRVERRFVSRPCLLDVRRRMPRRYAPSSHHLVLAACRLASSTRRMGRYDGVAAVLDFACLPPRFAILSVRFGIGWRRGLACPAPWPSSVPTATRSLAQSDCLAVLPPCRHAVPSVSSPSLPDHSTRGTGRGSLVLAACLCCSISPAIYLCWFCVLRRRWLSCLLGCRIMYVVDGVMR